MAMIRPVAALDSMPLRIARPSRRRGARFDRRGFGTRPVFPAEMPEPRAPALGHDLELFLTTFAAGFLFVSVFIG
jgi:hypothetical protein